MTAQATAPTVESAQTPRQPKAVSNGGLATSATLTPKGRYAAHQPNAMPRRSGAAAAAMRLGAETITAMKPRPSINREAMKSGAPTDNVPAPLPTAIQPTPNRQKRSAPMRSENRPKKIALPAASALNADTSHPAWISESWNSSFNRGSAGDILPKAKAVVTPARRAPSTANQRVLTGVTTESRRACSVDVTIAFAGAAASECPRPHPGENHGQR